MILMKGDEPMRKKDQLDELSEVRTTRQEIEQWRQTRANIRVPMPIELWDQAVELARRHGLHSTACALGISYNALKRRSVSQGSPTTSNATDAMRFVEITTPLPSIPPPVSDVEVMITGSDGERFHLRTKAIAPADLAHIALALWSHR